MSHAYWQLHFPFAFEVDGEMGRFQGGRATSVHHGLCHSQEETLRLGFSCLLLVHSVSILATIVRCELSAMCHLPWPVASKVLISMFILVYFVFFCHFC